jgi:hypothetical protein
MWTYCSKEDVSDYCGLSESTMKDSWSEMVEDMITEYTGELYGGTQSYTESYDGTGSDILVLNNKPVLSVSSLTISDVNITSTEYKVYSAGYIRLVSTSDSALAEAIGGGSVFPAGQQNVTVSYTAQNASVPGRVRFAATVMISQIAMISNRGGADSSLSVSMASQRGGETSAPWPRPTDVTGKLRTIMRNTIGDKWKFS